MPFELQPVLKGNLLELRPLRPEDFDALYAVAADPLLWEQHPDPALAWEVFKQFANVPVESAGGRDCEELWFEASEGRPELGSPGFFAFVRQFLQDTEGGAEWHEQITAHFTCDPDTKPGLGEGGLIHASDLTDLETFFRAVEASEMFRAGPAFTDRKFELRLDAC